MAHGVRHDPLFLRFSSWLDVGSNEKDAAAMAGTEQSNRKNGGCIILLRTGQELTARHS